MYGLDNNSGISVMPDIAPATSPVPLWFTEGGANQSPSWPGQDWHNMIQAELLNVLLAAGITPDKANPAQLAAAIKAIISNGSLMIKNNLSEIKAAGTAAVTAAQQNLSLGAAASLGVATNSQMQAGTSINLLPTVAAVMSLFKRNYATTDYLRLPDVPGGLVLQWGAAVTASTGVSVTLPFPLASAFKCFTTANQTSDVNTTFQGLTATSVYLQAYNQAGALVSGTTVNWFVIGVSA